MFFGLSKSVLKLSLILFGLLLAGFVSCDTRENFREANLKETNDSGEKRTVSLTIEFPDNRPHFERAFLWQDGMTVFDLLSQASQSDDELTIDSTGKKSTRFIRSIAGIENKGGVDHNWIFYVNGELAKASCGVLVVKPEDRVLWKFGEYR